MFVFMSGKSGSTKEETVFFFQAHYFLWGYRKYQFNTFVEIKFFIVHSSFINKFDGTQATC